MELFKITESSLSNHKISVWTLWTPWPHLILRPRCLGVHRWAQAQICYLNKMRWVILIGSSQIKIFEWVEVVHLTTRCHFCDGSISENVQLYQFSYFYEKLKTFPHITLTILFPLSHISQCPWIHHQCCQCCIWCHCNPWSSNHRGRHRVRHHHHQTSFCILHHVSWTKHDNIMFGSGDMMQNTEFIYGCKLNIFSRVWFVQRKK